MQGFDFGQLGGFFEETDLGRRLLFGAAVPQGIGESDKRRISENLFVPSFNQFLTQIGGQLQRGQKPSSFTDFVQNDFNLTRGLARLPEQSTPGLTSRANFGF
jgi:hypothetical protein